MMCNVLDITRSGYYAWLSRVLCKTKQENIKLTEKISTIFEQSRGVYGAPRIKASIDSKGHCYGKNRVAILMRIERLKGRSKRVWRRTAQSNPYPILHLIYYTKTLLRKLLIKFGHQAGYHP